jgi:hypothetical protein
MAKKLLSLIFLTLIFLTGCNAAINMNGKIIGINSGRFIYQDGNVIYKYKAEIDPVMEACVKALTELKAAGIETERKISQGMIKAVIQDEKIVIKVEYVERNLTSVSVFAGMVGNKMISRLLHEKINENLTEN